MYNYTQITTDKTVNTRHTRYSDVLTVEEACDYLKVGRNSIFELIKSKRLDSFKVGNRRLISRRSLRKYITKAEEEEKKYGE